MNVLKKYKLIFIVFLNWKQSIEHKTQSQYVVLMAEREIKSKNCIRKEYFCHRSYSMRSSEERKRSMKSLGTNKIGAVCPSRMIVDNLEEQVEVTFISKHIGHLCEVIRTKIPKDERFKIAGKTRKGHIIYKHHICTAILIRNNLSFNYI